MNGNFVGYRKIYINKGIDKQISIAGKKFTYNLPKTETSC
jgi:hypothetical protein